MTEEEAATVAEAAARCVWDGRSYLGPIMRYGRLFRPGPDAGGGVYPMIPAYAGRNAYRRAVDDDLLYAEGYACFGGVLVTHSAWCLDGEIVVDPGFEQPRGAYFGVALRPGYLRRVHEARRADDGSDGFEQVFTAPAGIPDPPLDPGSDVVADLGREIPAQVRDWALTAEPGPGDPIAPAWVLDALLTFPEPGPEEA